MPPSTPRRFGAGGKTISLPDRHQPDVAELYWVAVVLKQDGPWGAGIARQTGRRHVDDLLLAVLALPRDPHAVMDLHAIEDDADDPWLRWLAVLADRRPEVDVVALPDGRRLARVDRWFGDAVDATAIALAELVGGDAVTVEHLHLVAALEIDA